MSNENQTDALKNALSNLSNEQIAALDTLLTCARCDWDTSGHVRQRHYLLGFTAYCSKPESDGDPEKFADQCREVALEVAEKSANVRGLNRSINFKKIIGQNLFDVPEATMGQLADRVRGCMTGRTQSMKQCKNAIENLPNEQVIDDLNILSK